MKTKLFSLTLALFIAASLLISCRKNSDINSANHSDADVTSSLKNEVEDTQQIIEQNQNPDTSCIIVEERA